MEKRKGHKLRKNKGGNNYYGNNQGDGKFNYESQNLIKPGLAFRNRAEDLVHRNDDGVEKLAGHPDNPHGKKNIKGAEGADLQQPVQHRRYFYNGIKLFCKADYKIIDVRINAQDSHEYCKDNHGNRNERKNKTKGAGRSTFPQGIFRKVGKRKVKNLPELRKYFFEIRLKRGHIYIIDP